MNILFLRVGIFSNVNLYLVEAMSRAHHIVGNIDAGKVIKRKSHQVSSWCNLLHTIIHCKKYWRQSHSKNTYAFSRMTQYCSRYIRSRTDYDLIFQTQCKFSIAENPYARPYYIYTDLTQKLTDRLWPGWALKGSSREKSHWYRLETEAFQRTEKIFTLNEEVKASFVDDYQIPPDHIIIVGSGINRDSVSAIDFEKKAGHPFTLCFLTTDFERQGGPTVLQAYQLIHQRQPGIRLIIGGKCPKNLPGHVEIRKQLTETIIDQILDESHIFLMPGAIGGVQSVLQAMSKNCLCIVGHSNILLTGLVTDKQTGIVVPTDNPAQLAERILELYQQPFIIKQMVDRAYGLAVQNFTWDHIVQKMTRHFES